jgi:hypothetical protein
MNRFHPIDSDFALLLPLSVQDWLSRDDLARYRVEVLDGLDLSILERGVTPSPFTGAVNGSMST